MSLAQTTLDDIWALFRETDREFQEGIKETDKKIKQFTESVGHLSNRLGDFVEEMVRPAAVRLEKLKRLLPSYADKRVMGL